MNDGQLIICFQYTIQHFRHGTYLNGLVYYSDITRMLSISDNDI